MPKRATVTGPDGKTYTFDASMTQQAVDEQLRRIYQVGPKPLASQRDRDRQQPTQPPTRR